MDTPGNVYFARSRHEGRRDRAATVGHEPVVARVTQAAYLTTRTSPSNKSVSGCCAHGRLREAEEPGAIARQDALLHYRSATRAEIDFTAGWLDGVPCEGKYTEGPWLRETQTATAAYGRCVLATRNVTERVSDEKRQLLAIPAPMLALLIDPRPDTEAHSV